jgi:Carboxypeptidase regulatory-like domain/TonB dependent receptor
MKRLWMSSLLFSVLLAWTKVPALAQVGSTEVVGTVSDSSDAVLPGVTVTATQVGVGVTRSTVTDTEGRFTFTQLPVGRWNFEFTLAGFNTVKIDNFEMNVGRRPTLTVTMQIAGVAEVVTVQADTPLIQTTRSELSDTIQDIQVEQLPVLGRDWLGFAVLAAGIKSDGSETTQDSAPKAGIGLGRQDKVVIDGADVNNRSTSSGVDIKLSKEVIAEFEVKTNQFDAQFGQSGTSITQAVTKSGTDQISGSGFFYFRDESLNAEEFFLTDNPATPDNEAKPPYQNKQTGLTIGGPIIKGKTHFFFSYEYQTTPRTLSSNVGIPSIDSQQVDGTDTRNLWFIRGDHQITDDHRAAFRYNRSTRLQPASGTGGTLVPGASLDFDFWINRYNASLDSVIGSKWFNSLIFNVMDTNRLFGKRGEEVIGPSISPRLTTAGPSQTFPAASLGGSVGGGFENPDYWSLRDDLSVFFEKGGQHNLKFGGYLERAKLAGFFLAGTNGNFFYDRNPTNLATCCASENQSEWDTSQFPPAVRYSQNLGEPSIDSEQNFWSGYIQDDWTIGNRFTLNLGLRYDLETGSLENSNPEGTFLQPDFSNDKDNLQPRVGFAYDLRGDGNTILRGGAGMFYSQAFLNIALLVQRSNRPQEINVTVLNEDGDIGFNTDPLDGRTFEDFQEQIGTVPVDVTIYPEGTEIPNLWSYSIGVAHQLTPTIAIEADYVHQRSDNQFKSIDTNLFYDEANDRALPVRSGNFVELGGEVTGVGRPDPQFNQIWEVQNAAKARYHGLSVAVTKRFTNRLSFGGTYLLSKNEDSTDDFDSFPSNNFDIEDEFGTSLNDQRHRTTGNWVWEMPHNFVFSGLVYAGSGTARRTVANGLDLFSTAPQGRGLLPRPTCGLDPRFSRACGILGIADGERVPRNAFRTESVFRVDVRVGWRAYMGEKVHVEPTFEVFNLFNRNNLDPSVFNTNLGSAGFGNAGRSSNQPYLPRQVQLGVILRF